MKKILGKMTNQSHNVWHMRRLSELDNYLYSPLSFFQSKEELAERYLSIRRRTIEICRSLEVEDQSVQPSSFVSPPKWHLGHTTWFFEEMLLKKYGRNYSSRSDFYGVIFNSYYQSVGDPWRQGERGHLSRPTVKEIIDYRNLVDEKVMEVLLGSDLSKEREFAVEVGLHHEQQHQELLLMDIKYILNKNPCFPVYSRGELASHLSIDEISLDHWCEFSEGIYQIGYEGPNFSFDNEGPRHKVYVHSFGMSDKAVTNGQFLEFVQSGAYQNVQLWLSLGWEWVNKNGIRCPLYWLFKEKEWFEFTLYGLQPLNLDLPLTHVSYFEANAYANWSGHRLPTEQESEIFLSTCSDERHARIQESFHPNNASAAVGQVWWWTQSQYSPYPGYRPFDGELGEYNGKFMCNQFVLRGGSICTPKGHYRHSYRNFYEPSQRWMFSGIRLAKDLR